ncbi:MAG: hypothetical protein SGILL_004715 [Bacillariaceae sp.]
MNEPTPRVFNRKTANDGGQGGTRDDGSNRMRILSKVSSEYDYSDEKKDSELTNTEASGHYRNARGSGWIQQKTMSPMSKSTATPNRRNHSTAVNVLEKLQMEVASKPTYRKPSPMERMRDGDTQEAASSAIRYKMAEPKKSNDQVKKDKQRIWKEKMKIAQERKRQEKKNLDEASKQGSGGGDDDDDEYGKMMISCVLDSVEQAEFFKNLTSCGDLPDEDSIYEGWSAASSMQTSDEDESNAHIMSRQVTRGRSRVPRRPSESSISSRETSSVSTSEQEDSPSPPAADKYPVRKKNVKASAVAATKFKSEAKPMKPAAAASPTRTASPPRQAIAAQPPPAVTPSPEQKQPRSSFNASSSVHPVQRTDHSRQSASTMTTRPPAPSKERNFINGFLDDMKTMGESMLWHKETSALNPATVTVRIVKGYRSDDGTFCGPRLSWRDDAKDENYEVDLFDIQSLKKADTLELANFPYAMPGRTVCMKFSTGIWFIFEARSEDDAFRFVRGIRWVISRLAFNLVIGNVDVSCELLDLGLVEENSSPMSTVQEFDWSRAMDDVTDQLVEKSLATTMI